MGGKRKGFHVASLSPGCPVGDPINLGGVSEVAAYVEEAGPSVIGIDSPRHCADPGESSRADERSFRAAGICAIRWTPDEEAVSSGGLYFEWVRHGLSLYRALEELIDPERLVEVFPTAAWTQLYGPKGARSRSEWSTDALDSLGLELSPTRRWGQDDRDSIAAAYTALLLGESPESVLRFGDLAVPAHTGG